MGSQQLVILAREDGAGSDPSALGTREEVVRRLSAFNTAPEADDGEVLFGPGIRIELPPQEPVSQMLLTIVEEEIAWQVVMRLAKAMEWRLLDPSSGREFSP